MSETSEGRVAVYIDFDNIVISRYDQLHGDGAWRRDKVRNHSGRSSTATGVAERIRAATVDISAVLDFASSFGTIVLSRAYADWSVPVNASYRSQLIDRAVDLTQLFPTVKSMKNGADIRLAVDVVEDLFRLSDLTHIVIVAGDSDYIALSQRAKRLGRYVVGIGVAGGTSRALAAACDEFADYDSLPGVGDEADNEGEPPTQAADTAATRADAAGRQGAPSGSGRGKAAPAKAAATATQDADEADAETVSDTDTGQPRRRPSTLLVRAMQLLQAKQDQEWLNSSTVKNQMLRMDPSFSESSLGFSNFTDFVKSRGGLVELKEDGERRLIRLRPAQRE